MNYINHKSPVLFQIKHCKRLQKTFANDAYPAKAGEESVINKNSNFNYLFVKASISKAEKPFIIPQKMATENA